MNKAELVEKIANDTELPKTKSETVLVAITDAIAQALKKGDKITLPGFGTFSVSKRKGRSGRNPQTGEKIKIAARKVAKFTPGTTLKEMVNK